MLRRYVLEQLCGEVEGVENVKVLREVFRVSRVEQHPPLERFVAGFLEGTRLSA